MTDRNLNDPPIRRPNRGGQRCATTEPKRMRRDALLLFVFFFYFFSNTRRYSNSFASFVLSPRAQLSHGTWNPTTQMKTPASNPVDFWTRKRKKKRRTKKKPAFQPQEGLGITPLRPSKTPSSFCCLRKPSKTQ